MDQLTNIYRNVEIQLGQIASVINNKNQGELPNITEVNPREHVKTITFHSGKQLNELPGVERMKEKENERKEEEWGNELVEESE